MTPKSTSIKSQAFTITAVLTFLLFSSFSLHTAAQPAPWVGETFEGRVCQQRQQGFGPFDYTKRYSSEHKNALRLVEGAHFNQNVESLRSGAKQKYNLLGDIDYTLRAFPNHHRALNTVIRYRLMQGKPYNKKELSPAECYLQRAINYSPEDETALMLYAMLLQQTDKPDQALEYYQKAASLAPANWNIKYNMALVLVDLKQYEQANTIAQQIYATEFPLPGLKNRLIRSGHWQPQETPPSQSPSLVE